MLANLITSARLSALAPWFPPHLQRDIYHSLLNIEPPAGSEPASVVPKSLLKAALLQRAIEDIHRVVDVRSKKQACSTLLEKKSISDSLWHQLLGAEKEMEVELRNVVDEVCNPCFFHDLHGGMGLCTWEGQTGQ